MRTCLFPISVARRTVLRLAGQAIVVAAAAAISTAALAQSTWPQRPIRLVVGFPAGGQSDIMGRMVADALAKELGQPVVVENKGGASGLIAAEHVKRQSSDGYTLMLTSESLQSRAVAVFKKLPYDPIADFEPIGKFGKQRTLMVVHPASKFNSVKEVLAFAKANPGRLFYSSTYSTSSQFGGALFGLLNGIEMTPVSYMGGAKPITDLLGGQVDVGFLVESTVAEHVKAGKLKLLASASAERSSIFPDSPTLKEAGAAPMDVSPWFGIVAPAKTPRPIVDRISAALHRAIKSKDLQQRLDGIGAVPIIGSTPQAFGNDLKNEVAYWRKFVRDSNFPLLD